MRNIVVFGGSKVTELFNAPLRQLGRMLTEAEYRIVTGGGEGAMRLVAEGAKEAGGRAIGYYFGWAGNPKSDVIENRPVFGDYFDRVRKLFEEGNGYIVVASPQSAGTAAEFFDCLQLKLHKSIAHRPLVVLDLGGDFLPKLRYFIPEQMYEYFKVVNYPNQVLEYFKNFPWQEN